MAFPNYRRSAPGRHADDGPSACRLVSLCRRSCPRRALWRPVAAAGSPVLLLLLRRAGFARTHASKQASSLGAGSSASKTRVCRQMSETACSNQEKRLNLGRKLARARLGRPGGDTHGAGQRDRQLTSPCSACLRSSPQQSSQITVIARPVWVPAAKVGQCQLPCAPPAPAATRSSPLLLCYLPARRPTSLGHARTLPVAAVKRADRAELWLPGHPSAAPSVLPNHLLPHQPSPRTPDSPSRPRPPPPACLSSLPCCPALARAAPSRPWLLLSRARARLRHSVVPGELASSTPSMARAWPAR